MFYLYKHFFLQTSEITVSEQICAVCVDFLFNILNFRIQSETAHKTLLERIQQQNELENEIFCTNDDLLFILEDEADEDINSVIFKSEIDIESAFTDDELKELECIENLSETETEEEQVIIKDDVDCADEVISQIVSEDSPEKINKKKKDKNGLCEICGEDFPKLTNHIRMKHPSLPCPYCNQMFIAPSLLKIHITKHTGEKYFKCEICGKETARSGDLKV